MSQELPPHLQNLKDGLEGDMSARAAYLNRTFAYASLPPWAQIHAEAYARQEISAEAKAQATKQVTLRGLSYASLNKAQRKQYELLVKQTADRLRSKYQRNMLALKTLGHALGVVSEIDARNVFLKFDAVGNAVNGGVQAVRFAVHATALQDFLKLHSFSLKSDESLRVAADLNHVWEIPDHPVIKPFLAAEQELLPVFERLATPLAERNTAIRRAVARGEGANEIKAFLERVRQERSKKQVAVPKPEPKTDAPVDDDFAHAVKYHFSRFVESYYPGLSKSEIHDAANRVLHMDLTGKQSFEETIKLIRKADPADLPLFIKGLHDQHFEKKVPPNKNVRESDKQIDSGGKKPREKTAVKLLSEVNRGGKMAKEHDIAFKKALIHGEFEEDAALSALKHSVLFYLSTGGRESGVHKPHRVRFDSLVGNKHLPEHPLLKQAVRELVDEGKIVHRETAGRPSKGQHPVTISPKIRHLYGH